MQSTEIIYSSVCVFVCACVCVCVCVCTCVGVGGGMGMGVWVWVYGCMGMNAKCCATTVSSQILEKPAPMSKCSGSCSTTLSRELKREVH